MGYAARNNAAAIEQMLPREDVSAVAAISLMETIIIDLARQNEKSSAARDVREYRVEIGEILMSYVQKYSGTFRGRVTVELATKCDRYLCKVQDAMDTFFDELTEEDLAMMSRVKANWPQTEGTDEVHSSEEVSLH
jgi:malate synthase